MASVPQTWKALQALQWTIYHEVQVGGGSPFAPFTAADQAKWGNNPNGTVATAIYFGEPPKKLNPGYIYQCFIIPDTESVTWRAAGGKVFDELQCYLFVAGLYTTDFLTVVQTIIAIRDAMHPVLMTHAQQQNAPTVVAAKPGAPSGDRIHGFHHRQFNGADYYCWGVTRWVRQEWSIPNGITA